MWTGSYCHYSTHCLLFREWRRRLQKFLSFLQSSHERVVDYADEDKKYSIIYMMEPATDRGLFCSGKKLLREKSGISGMISPDRLDESAVCLRSL